MMLAIGSLCSGYGGLEMGVQQVLDARVAWHCDNSDAAWKVLAHRHPDTPIHHDLITTAWEDVESVDILTAGYPCQPMSQAGQRKGSKDARYLWPYVAETISVLRPLVIFLENVRNHLRIGYGDVLGALAELGYDAEWCVLPASDVGAPHRRERVFLVAHDRAAPHPGRHRCEGGEERDLWTTRGNPPPQWDDSDGRVRTVHPEHGTGGYDWAEYEPAIRRWERVLRRAAPVPVENGPQGGQRIRPAFVEWSMGLPSGWVTDVPGLGRREQLTLLGNGVVPQQAAAAFADLLSADWAGAA